jgi:hypothetical protein
MFKIKLPSEQKLIIRDHSNCTTITIFDMSGKGGTISLSKSHVDQLIEKLIEESDRIARIKNV